MTHTRTFAFQNGGADSPVYVCMEVGYNVTFALHLALHNFPFDYHEPALEIMLKFEDAASFDLQMFFVEIHSVCTKMEEFCILVPSVSRINPRHTNLLLNLSRRPVFWMHSIVFLSMSMQFLMLLVFAIPAADVADRIGSSFTLILTMVAFRTYVVASEPKAEYLTLLDNYINYGTLGSIGICIATALTGEGAVNVDRMFFWLSLPGIVVYNCFYARIARRLWQEMPDELAVADGKWASFQYGATLEERLACDCKSEASAKPEETSAEGGNAGKGGIIHTPIHETYI